MRRPREHESAAAKYTYLRGLTMLPLGALLILAALANAEVGPSWAFPVAVAAGAAVWLWIARYYGERYGRISPSSRQQLRATLAALLAVAVMAGGSVLLKDAPVNAIAVPFAVVMLIAYAIGMGLAPHHVVVWGGLVLAGTIWTGDNEGLVLMGVAVIVNGVLDHRQLVRRFGSPGLLRLEDGDVGA